MRSLYGHNQKGGRADNDFYATDPIAAKMLLSVEKFDKNVWECASGENHLADVFKQYGYSVRTSDLIKRTPSTEVLDFLSSSEKWKGDIITNPPYSDALEFVKKALSLVSKGHKVAMFLRLQFLEGIERYKFFMDNPPKVVYVASKRIKCGKNGDFKSSMSSIQCYAWFVWEKGYKGDSMVRWINVNEVSSEKMKECKYKEDNKPLLPSDILSLSYRIKVKDKWGKSVNLNIQRVECSIYEKLGFSRYHYIQCPINKASMCLLVRTSKGKPLGFIGFLNHTFKNCPNGLMVSRFVILPQYQRRGLALPILTRICGMLKAEGYRVFINTENHHLGKALTRSYSFRGTTFDQKERYIQYDAKYRHRRGGFAYRKEYCGSKVYGYGRMLKEVNVMRENKGKVVEISGKTNDNKAVKPIYHPTVHHSHAVEVAMSGACAHSRNVDMIGVGSRCGTTDRISALVYDMPQCSARGTP